MGRQLVGVIGLCLAAVLIGAGLGSHDRLPELAVGAREGSTQPPQDATIAVHVSGWVVNPGVVVVAEGSIVADAVVAAGGARPGAALDAINLAGPMVDGDQVQVPGPGAVTPSGSVAQPGTPGGVVSLNRADASALQELPGVGPVLAERIIDFRESNGPFAEVEDLLDVPGIGEAKLSAIRDLVSVP